MSGSDHSQTKEGAVIWCMSGDMYRNTVVVVVNSVQTIKCLIFPFSLLCTCEPVTDHDLECDGAIRLKDSSSEKNMSPTRTRPGHHAAH